MNTAHSVCVSLDALLFHSPHLCRVDTSPIPPYTSRLMVDSSGLEKIEKIYGSKIFVNSNDDVKNEALNKNSLKTSNTSL